jgi:hypothetical protein
MPPLDTAAQQREHTRRLTAPGPCDNEWAALTTALIRQGLPYDRADREARSRLARRCQIRRALLLASTLAILILVLI